MSFALSLASCQLWLNEDFEKFSTPFTHFLLPKDDYWIYGMENENHFRANYELLNNEGSSCCIIGLNVV